MDSKRIAILGAGPSGVTAAKFLKSEGFQHIDLFEQQSTTGGAWNYTPQTLNRLPKVPLTNPNGVEEPHDASSGLLEDSEDDTGLARTDSKTMLFLSPMYDQLETNLPKPLMQFNNPEFASDLPLFPKHADVARYVQQYSKDVEDRIKFNTQIQSVRKLHGKKWTVVSRNILSGRCETGKYDFIVMATGNYSVPYIPPISGIEAFEATYPGSIQHSKYFRNAGKYKGKKVIVVGNSASGVDIVAQIAAVAAYPTLHSIRSPSALIAGGQDPRIKEIRQIASFDVKGRSVTFVDGTVQKGVDAVLFATGYHHSYPFLKDLVPPSVAPEAGSSPHEQFIEMDEDEVRRKGMLITDGQRVHSTYQHLFYSPDPTLVIMALPYRIVPFPLSECQAAVVAGVWSGRLTLPSSGARRNWESQRIESHGNGKTFHMLQYPEDYHYIEYMNEWNSTNRHQNDTDSTRRLQPSQWGVNKRWLRENFTKVRKAFVEARDEGRIATTVEDLGFSYEPCHEPERLPEKKSVHTLSKKTRSSTSCMTS